MNIIFVLAIDKELISGCAIDINFPSIISTTHVDKTIKLERPINCGSFPYLEVL